MLQEALVFLRALKPYEGFIFRFVRCKTGHHIDVRMDAQLADLEKNLKIAIFRKKALLLPGHFHDRLRRERGRVQSLKRAAFLPPFEVCVNVSKGRQRHFLVMFLPVGQQPIIALIPDELNRHPVDIFIQVFFHIRLRTAAENAPDEVLIAEAEALTDAYRQLIQKAEHSPAPAKIAAGQPVYLEWLQGLDKSQLQEVITDIPAVYEELAAYFARIGLPSEKLRLYSDPMITLGQLYSLEKTLGEATGRRVWLDSGAYLIIEHTEAMTVIDVNSGKDEKDAKSLQAAETINREAAREITRQLLLRNLSGMVMVDFINMKRKGAEADLLDYMRELTDRDPVFVKVLDITPLGIMELTRRRIRRPFH